jgi:hypothetical protein
MSAAAIDPDEIHERALARWSILEAEAEYDLGTFIELYQPKYSRPDHLRDVLEACDRSMHEPVFALIEAPPQHGKTETLLAACARRLRYRPDHQIAYCAYGASLALRKSRRCREIASAAGVGAGSERIIRKSRFDAAAALSYWQTDHGGSFVAGGRNGGFTGDGYDKVLADDLLKNREEAESPLIQEKTMEVIRSTFGNRIRPGGSMFVTHQPWNDLDPIAQLKSEKAGPDGQAWEVISLPAVSNAEYDDDGNLTGGMPLWPARYSLRDLAKVKHRVGSYNWHSQYTLERLPRGDRVFKGEPGRFVQPQLDGAFVMISCDPGIEDNKMKDSSGIVVASCYRQASRFYLPEEPDFDTKLDLLLAEDQWRDWADLLDYLELLQTEVFRGAPILLEEVSAFKALSTMAARLNPRLMLYPVTPHGSKLLRAQPTAKAWARGHVRVPLGGTYDGAWVADFLREVARFTGKAGGRDNRVDALTQLYDHAGVALLGMDGAESGEALSMASSPFS